MCENNTPGRSRAKVSFHNTIEPFTRRLHGENEAAHCGEELGGRTEHMPLDGSSTIKRRNLKICTWNHEKHEHPCVRAEREIEHQLA